MKESDLFPSSHLIFLPYLIIQWQEQRFYDKYTMYNICQQMLKVASAALGQWPCISITCISKHNTEEKGGEEERKCSALVYWKKQRNKETKKETKKLGEI